MPGVGVEAISVKTGLSTLDLNLDLTESGGRVTGHLEYKAALFDRETAVLLRDALVETVAAVARDPRTCPADLQLPERLLVRQARSLQPPPMDRPHEGVLDTAAERLVGAIWREVLKLERVGPYDSFFDLGGDSLQAMVVIDRIEREAGHRLQPLDLGTMTLRQIAALSPVDEAA
jgi:acyl carrier protein